jgi:hypothetical protein
MSSEKAAKAVDVTKAIASSYIADEIRFQECTQPWVTLGGPTYPKAMK